jgi:hypothetical protein
LAVTAPAVVETGGSVLVPEDPDELPEDPEDEPDEPDEDPEEPPLEPVLLELHAAATSAMKQWSTQKPSERFSWVFSPRRSIPTNASACSTENVDEAHSGFRRSCAGAVFCPRVVVAGPGTFSLGCCRGC